ncbi:glycoside hydrolase family 79 protein [Favolaschia claudopus]|uniref:Glycoside hydrolase family 79 protein n=1 Tax=Favolaschia claudopus TaxID=2862362 RepID=A0AAW0E6P0_9AGAR
MRITARLLRLTLVLLSAASTLCIQLEIPASPPSTHTIIASNFLGISIELSSISKYLGNDTSMIPQALINYVAGVRARTGKSNVRMRVGGNSADSSTYVASQTSPMAVLKNPNVDKNSDNQAINYGPEIWAAMAKVSQMAGGVDYLFSVPLLNPNNTIPKLAADAKAALGNNLDALLLGNEPDLYQSHKERPNIPNYTIPIYETEFSRTVDILQSTFNSFAGPTICCSWNLADILQAGYVSNFTLRYVTLQHYPQNFCPGLGMVHQQFGNSYYIQHSNVVTLAAWQSPAYKTVSTNNSAGAPQLIMSEFNSASCGGIPGLSDTFAVGGLWALDYALQLASVGYSAAYIHTREPGITYNIFTSPPGPDGGPGNWTTNPPYYTVLAIAEALRTDNGGIVADLNLGGSMTDSAASQAGYAVYDAQNFTVTRLVLFNYAAESATFTLPTTLFENSATKSVLVKYLESSSGANETTKVSWAGKTFAGVGDGKSPVDAAWATSDQNLECSSGCSFNVSGTSMGMVFLDNAQFSATPGATGPQPTSSTQSQNSASHMTGLWMTLTVVVLPLLGAILLT